MSSDIPIRDAATIILLRRDSGTPRVLMGQRGASAAFMPDKFVFPGGGVDPDDLALAGALTGNVTTDQVLPLAAIRELWEETGLMLARPADLEAPPEAWRGFIAAGYVPDPSALRMFFRAITPPGRPRRFDARFYLAEASDLIGTPDDFSGASGELSYLQWVELDAARALALPFITEVVLAEIEAMLAEPDMSRPVPFFNHSTEGSHFRFL